MTWWVILLDKPIHVHVFPVNNMHIKVKVVMVDNGVSDIGGLTERDSPGTAALC